jgi:hypothetical protein
VDDGRSDDLEAERQVVRWVVVHSGIDVAHFWGRL